MIPLPLELALGLLVPLVDGGELGDGSDGSVDDVSGDVIGDVNETGISGRGRICSLL